MRRLPSYKQESLLDTPLTQRIVPVLAGGGTRLPAHVGVLTALQDMGIEYRHLVGVSGGSVVASLAAVFGAWAWREWYLKTSEPPPPSL